MPVSTEGPPAPRLHSEEHRREVARYAVELLEWPWFADSELMPTREENRTMAGLMLALYLAHQKGRKISKTEACQFMRVDAATTGPRYFNRLEAKRLLRVEQKPKEDRRKDFLIPSPQLIELVEAELTRLLVPAVDVASATQLAWSLEGVDVEAMQRVPPGEPIADLWPPHDVGRPLTGKDRR